MTALTHFYLACLRFEQICYHTVGARTQPADVLSVCVYLLHSSSVLRLEDKAQSSAVKTVTPHTHSQPITCVCFVIQPE